MGIRDPIKWLVWMVMWLLCPLMSESTKTHLNFSVNRALVPLWLLCPSQNELQVLRFFPAGIWSTSTLTNVKSVGWALLGSCRQLSTATVVKGGDRVMAPPSSTTLPWAPRRCWHPPNSRCLISACPPPMVDTWPRPLASRKVQLRYPLFTAHLGYLLQNIFYMLLLILFLMHPELASLNLSIWTICLRHLKTLQVNRVKIASS